MFYKLIEIFRIMRKFKFNLKNVATLVACFTVCIMLASCELTEDEFLETEANFITFTFPGIEGLAAINVDALTITAKASGETDLTKIVPFFTLSPGAKATVGGVPQESGVSQNNFSTPVTYSVISEDTKTNNAWTVTISKDGGPGVDPDDAVELTSAMINHTEAVLVKGAYLCKSNLTLAGGNKLTISPGVIIFFSANAGLTIDANARIIANGTATDSIFFTSAKTISDRAPGDWYGINVNGGVDCEFSFCVFEYGSGGSSWANTGLLRISATKAKVDNNRFSHSKYSGIYLYGAAAGFNSFAGNKLYSCGETETNAYPIESEGGLGCLDGMGVNTIITAKGIGVSGGNINSAVLLSPGETPIVFTRSPSVRSGGILTVAAGSTVKFAPNVQLEVQEGGQIIAEGEVSKRIIFTSSVPITPTNPTERWRGININNAAGCKFNYCDFENGSGSGYWEYTGMLRLSGCRASVTNSTFTNARYSGIYLYGVAAGFTTFEGNTISACGESEAGAFPIRAEGGIATLTGIGENEITTAKGIGVNGGTLTQALLVKEYVPYYFFNTSTITGENGIITIEPGSVLKFENERGLRFTDGGKIIANGSADKKITFTSAYATKRAGDLYGINIEGSEASEFSHCTFEYGSGSDYWEYTGMIRLRGCSASIENCTFSNSKYNGIYLYAEFSGFTKFENNTFTDCGEDESGSYPINSNDGIRALRNIGDDNTITSTKGIGINGGTVSRDTRLRKHVYTVYRNMEITSESGATLTIDAGATLRFSSDVELRVKLGGKLVAEGTAADKITFTSVLPQKGGWHGIAFNQNCMTGNILDYCNISNGGGAGNSEKCGNVSCLQTIGSQVSITNCHITNSRRHGIFLYNGASANMENNTFEGNDGSDVGTTVI